MDAFDALIVSHGQPSAPGPAEEALAEFAAGVRAAAPGLGIGAATMAAPDRLEDDLKRLKPGGAVYPLFMADGWFVRTALMGRIGTADVKLMTPFGMDPKLPGLIADELKAKHGPACVSPPSLLLAAHGSGSGRPAPERSTHDFARRLRDLFEAIKVEIGFLEQAPSIADALAIGGNGGFCLPFFAMEGNHLRQDVCQELAKAGFTGVVLPVISQFPGVAKMIADALLGQVIEDVGALKVVGS